MPDEIQRFLDDAIGVLQTRLGSIFDNAKQDAGPFLKEVGIKLTEQSLRYVKAQSNQERQMAQLQVNILIGSAEAEARIQQLTFVRSLGASGKDILEMALAVAGELLKKGLSILLKIPIP